MSAASDERPTQGAPTGKALPEQPATPAKLSDVQLVFSTRRTVGGGGPGGVERWTVDAALMRADADEAGRHTPLDPVGQIHVLVIDLLTCRDPWGALDSSNEDIAHIGETVFDMNTGYLAERFDSRLERAGHRVLVLDYVELRPEWQGLNVAALLVAESLDQLRTACRVALCLPGPLVRRPDVADADYEASVERMKGVWAQVGFRPYEEGVWFLDPNRRTLDESLATLRAAHGVA